MEARLLDIVIKTGMARSGMTVGDVFDECVRKNIPGIPYCDDEDRVLGRVSIRHTLKSTCIPQYVVDAAHLLGDDLQNVSISHSLSEKVLSLPVDDFVLEDMAIITAASPVVKALAIMEKYNTGYIFLIDNGIYEGIVTRMGIAQLMLKYR
ncbi:MAG: CBS domain-containing protein [Deltaproteobacteria bacterium]|nr:CBS domain-containing protein [Deltaproteobacteria bacterium]